MPAALASLGSANAWVRPRMYRDAGVAVDRGRHDPALAGRHQFRVRHDPGHAPVPAGEWMDLRDEEHHEDRAMQRSGRTAVDFEASDQGAQNQFRGHKDG